MSSKIKDKKDQGPVLEELSEEEANGVSGGTVQQGPGMVKMTGPGMVKYEGPTMGDDGIREWSDGTGNPWNQKK